MDDKKLRELSDAELDHVSGGALSAQTPSGNPTQGHGEGLVVVNPAGNAPPGQQF
jgi:bacteriocin-like protein